MSMESLGGRHDDGKHHEVGESHPGEDVESAGGLFVAGSSRTQSFERGGSRAPFGFVTHFFEAVRTLPKEEVWRYGRPKYGNQEREIDPVELDMGNEGVAENTAPLMGDENCHHEIRQECGAEQLENERDAGERAQASVGL